MQRENTTGVYAKNGEKKKQENTQTQARLDFYNIKSEQPADFLAANDQQTPDKFSV